MLPKLKCCVDLWYYIPSCILQLLIHIQTKNYIYRWVNKLNRFIKWMHIFLALVFLAIAFIGVIVPLVPSTPFLLLASYFAVRGSTKLNTYIKSTKMYNEQVVLFVEERKMLLKTKIVILTTATVMLCFPFYFVKNTPFRVFVVLLIMMKYVYFFKVIKTVKEEEAYD